MSLAVWKPPLFKFLNLSCFGWGNWMLQNQKRQHHWINRLMCNLFELNLQLIKMPFRFYASTSKQNLVMLTGNWKILNDLSYYLYLLVRYSWADRNGKNKCKRKCNCSHVCRLLESKEQTKKNHFHEELPFIHQNHKTTLSLTKKEDLAWACNQNKYQQRVIMNQKTNYKYHMNLYDQKGAGPSECDRSRTRKHRDWSEEHKTLLKKLLEKCTKQKQNKKSTNPQHNHHIRVEYVLVGDDWINRDD